MNNEQKIEMLKKIMIDSVSEMEERINEVDESEYDVCRMELNGIIDQKISTKKY
tara:strand:+ start:442 stop:603 length:162 start_codon:yes stop_codon:yes gene_type:complete